MKYLFSVLFISGILFSCSSNHSTQEESEKNQADTTSSILNEGENHFKSLKQLTFGGDNAEAYWSFDDSKLVFQVTNPKWELECDQIFMFD